MSRPWTEVVVRLADRPEIRRILEPAEHLLGRNPECAIPIDCPDVSDHHARLLLDGEGVVLEDLGSTNGSYLNGQRVIGRVRLLPPKRFHVGNAVVEIIASGSGTLPRENRVQQGNSPPHPLFRQRMTPSTPFAPFTGMPPTWLVPPRTPRDRPDPIAGYAARTPAHPGHPPQQPRHNHGNFLDLLSTSPSQVSDLTPLEGVPLVELILSETRVANLAPMTTLRSLNVLHLDQIRITNLSAVSSLPLRSLRLDGCRNLVDLRPLQGCTQLTLLTLPAGVAELGCLRQLPHLERLGYRSSKDWSNVRTAAEYWAAFATRNC